MRKSHRWIGIISVLFIFVLTITGLGLLHYPKSFHITDIIDLDDHQNLIGTTKGLYMSSGDLEELKSLRIPGGHVVDIERLENTVAAGYKYGRLYVSTNIGKTWKQVQLPESIGTLYNISLRERGILILTDTGAYYHNLNSSELTTIMTYSTSARIKQFLIAWHTGYFLNPLKWLYTLAAIGLIYLGISGIKLSIKK